MNDHLAELWKPEPSSPTYQFSTCGQPLGTDYPKSWLCGAMDPMGNHYPHDGAWVQVEDDAAMDVEEVAA